MSEQYVDVPGGKIYVKCWMLAIQNERAPVVLFHDSLGCVEMWRDFPRFLCESSGRTVIAYDRLGFGRSSKRQELPSAHFVREEVEFYFPNLLKALAIKRFVLFGHSVGGAMAVACAAHFASDCTAVITESAQAFVEDRTRQGILKAKLDFENPERFGKLEKYHGDKTKWVLDAWIEVWLSDEFSEWSLQNDLPKMRCPSLVIHGDKDEYGSLKFPEMICALAGGSTEKQIIQNCGHVPHREKQELILSLSDTFLRGH